MSPSSKRRRPEPPPRRPAASHPSPSRPAPPARPAPSDEGAGEAPSPAGPAESGRRFARLAPAAGVAYALLSFIGSSLLPIGEVDLDDPAERVARQFTEDRGRISAGILVTLISLFLLMVFVAWLHRWLRDVEGPGGWLATLALMGGILTVAMVSVVLLLGLASSVLEGYGSDPVIARTLLVLRWQAWAIVFVPTAALIGGASAVGLVAGVLPKWLTYTGLAIALGLLLLPIASLPFLFSTLWIGMLAVTLLQRARLEGA